MYTIELINYIKSPVSEVYQTLITAEGLRSIWTRKLTVKADIGFVNQFDFGEEELTEMKILELVENRKIHWECIHSDEEWVGTAVTFELTQKEGITSVVLKHSNWRELTEYYQWCNYNWSMFLLRLKNHCENKRA
ncbi:SRPBCC domain-containing protein [Sphingobacterium phlebotomi]|uniref:SRPBCC domain-containing protein n=1 Tax=Sphingobacterium phlebotomi TaxID=2605433 RepID=A0A5D4H568_9SPHI|nr:SRPBCC domain-containing protein [Sphingobacterium phlebotomi]TYR36201.1 SRPBCC domain-containing protein [Sphingobacterium phlebotomi]